MVRQLDSVSSRLRQAADLPQADVLQWLNNQQQRRVMRRRAVACVLCGWLLMLTAALIGAAVSIYLRGEIRDFLSGELPLGKTGVLDPNYVPGILVAVTLLLLLGGLCAWWTERIPGFQRTLSAIEWSTAGDAVTRLLRMGCTFPEAYRTAAEVVKTNRVRSWLIWTAKRIESGGPELDERVTSSGDTAIVESLVAGDDNAPDRRWKLASDHFFHVAQRRLTLLLQTVPMIATILSGLIVWLAITSTLGVMWRAAGSMMQDLGGGYMP